MIDKSQKITTHPKTGRVHVETVNNEPSLTQQQFKDECDINNIINRFAKTGEFLHLTSKVGQYADFSGITDYHFMLNQVLDAQSAFDSLPATLRQRFSNDPGELIQFLQNPNNTEEAIKLGLVNQTQQTNDEQTQTNDEYIKQKTTKLKPTPPSSTKLDQPLAGE